MIYLRQLCIGGFIKNYGSLMINYLYKLKINLKVGGNKKNE